MWKSFLQVWKLLDDKCVESIAHNASQMVGVSPAEFVFTGHQEARAVIISFDYGLRYSRGTDGMRYSAGPVLTPYEPVDISIGKWLAEVCLWCNWHHVGTLESLVDGEVVKVDAEQTGLCLQQNTVVAEIVWQFAKAFHG